MAYIGINNVARKVTEIYIGVNGVARRVVKGYVGDGTELARMWWGSSFIPGPDPEPDVPSGDYPVLSQHWSVPLKANIGTLKITKIDLVDSYEPATTPDFSWAADERSTGAIMGYRYGTEIIIAGNGSGRISAPVNSKALFYLWDTTTGGLSPLTEVEELNGLNILDTSNVTSMYSMFDGMNKVRALDVSNFDTRNVTTMQQMFTACKQITSLDLSSFELDNVTHMGSMFVACPNLKVVYVGEGWQVDSTKVNTLNMFYDCGCSSVTHK